MQIMSEKIKWISIERLLDTYSIPVLAEAVDKLNVQTHDETGRRILANNNDENDIRSKAFAKAHLAERRALDSDPLTEDEEQWGYERTQIYGSPLDLFGWPKDHLPDFAQIQPHYRPDNDPEWWTKRSLHEFEEEYKKAGSYRAAGELYGVSRQRYTEVIKAKRKSSSPFKR